MTESTTPFGRLIVGEKEELFVKAVDLASEVLAKIPSRTFSWALTGGSTPQEWYRWCAAGRTISQELRSRAVFTVSDERHVPLESDQSNFGNAERLLLAPLGVPIEHRMPWPVERPATEAAVRYGEAFAGAFGRNRAYDLCMLGMGDDAHTASLFPGSPLLREPTKRLFTSVEVPGRGWRLTITPTGLFACGKIVLMTLGAGKRQALQRVFQGADDPVNTPSQILRTCADRVVWLVDNAAAASL
ncbi:6-phosphogluconolactonase [Opitutaceae bacterium EW11]|nr:6-phosphogluconolactonase [Opitutaceae bacterium EW11]